MYSLNSYKDERKKLLAKYKNPKAKTQKLIAKPQQLNPTQMFQKQNLIIIIGGFLLLFPFFSSAQSDYFQQEVNYTIDVVLDDENHTLSAFETIEYTNNSPNELSFIYMHLWPNAYKNDKTAMAQQLYENGELKFYYAPDSIRGYIDSLDFKVNGKSVQLVYDSIHIDIAKIILKNPLKSGESVQITTPFHVKIPKGIFSRLGHIGQAYQITQWYPKPAVYDNNGWNQMPYLTQGEFYSEYGTFDVSITLPKNYILGATGNMVDGETELNWLDSIAVATDTITEFDTDMSFPISSEEVKTVRFHQDRVHDFAWFADKRYHVLKGEVELPHSKEKVTTWAMFTNNEADLWKKSISYIDSSVYYYSLWNGDYPYKNCTAVDGALSAGGGMEYPTITVIGESGSDFGLETVIMHEVGHNWFYGILGSNEREHPWMDEGLNSFNERRYVAKVHPDYNFMGDKKPSKITRFFDLDLPHKEQYYIGYLYCQRKNIDQPIEFPSKDYLYMNYGTIVYMKTAIAFGYLKAYLGDEIMDKAMQEYYKKWQFKHPQPKDLQKVIENVSQKDLTWFFDDLLTTTRSIDYKISAKKETSENYLLKIKNKGNIIAPFSISGIKKDTVITTKWFEGTAKTTEINFPKGDYDQFKIDFEKEIPEANRRNNTLKNRGLFKKQEPFKLQLLGSIENPDKTQLFWTPIVGFNTTDKAMFGIAFYNTILPQKKFEYVFAPMYSSSGAETVGSASVAYNFTPQKGLFQQITTGVSGQRYLVNDFIWAWGANSTIEKLTPSIDFIFRKKVARSAKNHHLSLKGIFLRPKRYSGFLDNVVYIQPIRANQLIHLTYDFQNKTTLNPFNFKAKLEETIIFSKLSVTANFQFDFKKEKKSFDVRFFAGTFVRNKTNSSQYNWRIDGVSGYYDYAYENVYLDRANTNEVLNNQFAMGYGGFKMPTFGVGQSNKWITALNMKLDIPIGIPLGLFADIGFSSGNVFTYDFGVHVPLIKNVIEVYFPIAYSKNIKTAIATNGYKYKDLVRFTIHLNKINPFELIKNFEI